MEEQEVVNAIAESLPADEVAAPSPAEDQASKPEAPAEAPAQQAEPQGEVPFHLHPRWQELQREKEELRRQNFELLELAKRQPIVQTVAPAQDPDSGLTPEEKAFWAKVDQRAEQRARQIAAEKERLIASEIQEQRATNAAILYKMFQKDNPDILPGSPEEAKVIELFKRNYDLNDAANLVRLPKIQRELELQKQQKQVQKVQQKVAATQETTTVAPKSGLPESKAKSVRDYVLQNWPGGG